MLMNCSFCRFGLFLFVFFVSHCVQASLSFDKTTISRELLHSAKMFSFQFDFENTGKYPVEIKKISTSCGCTMVKPAKSLYLPKEKGNIEGTFIIGDRIGTQNQEITIETNDISKKYYKLTLKLYIKREINLSPKVLIWRIGNEPIPQNAAITSINPIEIQSIKSESDDVLISLARKDEDYKKYVFSISPRSTEMRLNSTIEIKTVNKASNEFKTCVMHILVR